MSDADPPAAQTTFGGMPPTEQKPPYPRDGWPLIGRIVLIMLGGSGPLYIFVFCQALVEHTLSTVHRDLLSLHTIIVVVLLTAGGIWAIRDWVREEIAESQRRKSEQRVPYPVRAEQRWRNKLAQARQKGDRSAEGDALTQVGFWLTEQERYAEAEPYLTQALALARTTGNRLREERRLCELAHCAFARGDLDEAETLCRQAQAVALTLSREDMPSAHPRDEYVLEEVANLYANVGQFLAEQRNERTEGRRMLAEAASRYHEMARRYELAAHAYRPRSRRRADEIRSRERALALEREMHDLERRYTGDGE